MNRGQVHHRGTEAQSSKLAAWFLCASVVQTGFMVRALSEIERLPGLEPGGIAGGETPPSTAGGTPAATEAWFMESALFEIELLTGLEPGIPGGGTPPLYGRRDAHRYGGPEGRKNGSPWREPWVLSCIGFRAPEGRSESTAVGLVFGGTQDVLPAPAFLIAPPGLLVSFGPCPHGSRRGLVLFRPVRGWEIEVHGKPLVRK